MAACKVCKKSEVSMLCICEECLIELQNKVKEKGVQEFVTRGKYLEKLKEIKNLNHALNHVTAARDVCVDKIEQLSSRNRELAEKIQLCRQFFNMAKDKYKYVGGQCEKHVWDQIVEKFVEMLEGVE
ncbi:hypothetical protein DW1_1127 [Proteiniborus sp. DW1]|uniref:hypothetical protein n=1 Tax=Proteiniborus sp. DW1 TaxID=1889883 RepID=UPI00092DF3A1|nr:hypothetical protein [Proteiniborus sp. DW1]SCG82700.1 hypothetical protein DW1_1127 [Proteiniborus sp. DW1]